MLRRYPRGGALLDAAHAGENVARALIARGAKPIADEPARKHVEGLAEGRTEGLAEGQLAEARQSIRELCDVLEVAWTTQRAAEVERLDGDALRALRTELVRQRHWPS